jgi:hypothetical protein
MTRQRRLKRRIRARMAKTGESYSTARREVLKRLGTAVPEQDDAPAATVPRQRRFYRAARRLLPGAALVVLVGAVVGVFLIDSGDEEGQRQPSDELPAGLRDRLDLDRVRSVECGGGRGAPVDIRSSLRPSGTATCRIRLSGPAEIIAFKREGEWQIMRGVAAPRTRRIASADKLPPGLRKLLVRRLDLDRVRSVDCGAGRQAPVELRSSLALLVQVPAPRSWRSVERRAVKMPRATGEICRTELSPSGAINVSAKVGDEWVEIVPRAAVAGPRRGRPG